MNDKIVEYEQARVNLQNAVMRWLKVGADLDEIVDEVEHTHEWYESENG